MTKAGSSKKWIPSLPSLGHTVRDWHSPHTRLPQTPTTELENWPGTCYRSQRYWALQVSQVTENLTESHTSAWTRTQVRLPLLTPTPRSPSTAEVFLSGERQRSGIHTQIHLLPAFGRSPASFTMALQELHYKTNTRRSGQIHHFLMQICKI